MGSDNEFVKKVLLNMKYDSSKSLSENKSLLIEANTVTWTADKRYELDVDWTMDYKHIQPGFTMYSEGGQIGHWGVPLDIKCPGPKCRARGRQIMKVLSDALAPTKYIDLIYYCPEIVEFKEYKSPMYVSFNGSSNMWDAWNGTLNSKLSEKFCISAAQIEPEEIELGNFQIATDETPSSEYNLDTSGKYKTQKAQEQPKKTQDEINKEILARKDASQVAPRLYASSLGYKDWASYQKQFCCPTYAENPKENEKCNQNIGLAFEQGWRPGDGVPEGMKSHYCKGEVEFSSDEVIIDDGTGQGIEGEGEGTYLDLNDGGKEALFVSKEDPYFKDLHPEETIWDAEFVGGESKLKMWFEENFSYPKDALRKKQSGVCEITFIVNTDGSLSDFTILRGSGFVVLDNYALELVKKMPNWDPATKDGVKIQSKVTMPIEFNLP
jgi:TonB family protein